MHQLMYALDYSSELLKLRFFILAYQSVFKSRKSVEESYLTL